MPRRSTLAPARREPLQRLSLVPSVTGGRPLPLAFRTALRPSERRGPQRDRREGPNQVRVRRLPIWTRALNCVSGHACLEGAVDVCRFPRRGDVTRGVGHAFVTPDGPARRRLRVRRPRRDRVARAARARARSVVEARRRERATRSFVAVGASARLRDRIPRRAPSASRGESSEPHCRAPSDSARGMAVPRRGDHMTRLAGHRARTFGCGMRSVRPRCWPRIASAPVASATRAVPVAEIDFAIHVKRAAHEGRSACIGLSMAARPSARVVTFRWGSMAIATGHARFGTCRPCWRWPRSPTRMTCPRTRLAPRVEGRLRSCDGVVEPHLGEPVDVRPESAAGQRRGMARCTKETG